MSEVNRFLRQAVIACAVVSVAGGLGLYGLQQRAAREGEWDLLPARPLDPAELEQAQAVLNARLTSLQPDYRVARCALAPLASGFRLTLQGWGHFEEIPAVISCQGELELRLVAEPPPPPEGELPGEYERLPFPSALNHSGRAADAACNTPVIPVKIIPELRCSRFNNVSFHTQGLEMETVITLQLLEGDEERFAKVTADNIGCQLAVVLDGTVHVTPRIQEKISGGRVELRGIRERRTARRLSEFLRAGALPCPFKAVRTGPYGNGAPGR